MRQEATRWELREFETGFHGPKVFDPTNLPEQPPSDPNDVKYKHEKYPKASRILLIDQLYSPGSFIICYLKAACMLDTIFSAVQRLQNG